MEVIKAKELGTCFGVERALNITESNIVSGETIFCLGELIHNNDVINYFTDKGVVFTDNINEVTSDKLIIRSHGAGKNIYDYCKSKNIEIIDATCPKVKVIHEIVFKECMKNEILIFGNSNHPEVIGINGWCSNKGLIYEDLDGFIKKNNIYYSKNYCIVFQTTYNIDNYKKIKDYFNNFENINIYNTVCKATEKRQNACKLLAKKCDTMIIIGGKQSSNTKKLFNISKFYCENSIWIENSNDINFDKIKKSTRIGITAGASTPDWIIEEVINDVRRE